MASVQSWADLHVDGVSVLLAQRLVLLGVERLALKVHMAHRTNKAGVMPGVTQSLNKLITSFNRKVTSMTLSAEKGYVIFLAVGLSVLHVEQAVSKRFATGCTHEAGSVPRLPQGMHHLPHDLGIAAGAGRGEELLVAVLTVNAVLFLHKADVGQRHVAVVTVKLLRMPGATQSHQEGASDNAVAGSTQRCPAAGCEPLGPLCHASRHRRERGGTWGEGGGTWCDWRWAHGGRSSRSWVGDIGRRRVCGLGQRGHLNIGGCCFTWVKFVSEVSIGHPRRSVGRRWGRWRGGRGNGGRAGLGYDRGRCRGWGRNRNRSRGRHWLGGVDAGCADHLGRGGANRDLNRALLSGWDLRGHRLLILRRHWLVLLRGRALWGWIHRRRRAIWTRETKHKN